MITMPQALREAIRGTQGKPLPLTGPGTHAEYVVLPVEIYNQIKGLIYEEGPLGREEKRELLIQAGLRARWDDPGMDVYNELDPRRQP